MRKKIIKEMEDAMLQNGVLDSLVESYDVANRLNSAEVLEYTSILYKILINPEQASDIYRYHGFKRIAEIIGNDIVQQQLDIIREVQDYFYWLFETTYPEDDIQGFIFPQKLPVWDMLDLKEQELFVLLFMSWIMEMYEYLTCADRKNAKIVTGPLLIETPMYAAMKALDIDDPDEYSAVFSNIAPLFQFVGFAPEHKGGAFPVFADETCQLIWNVPMILNSNDEQAMYQSMGNVVDAANNDELFPLLGLGMESSEEKED